MKSRPSFMPPPKWQLALAGMAILLLAGVGSAQAFLVNGTVRNAQGQGIAGVDIDAEDATTGAPIPLSGDGTAANGFYDIFLPPGTYNLTFTPPLGMQVAGKEIKNVVVTNRVTLDITLPDGFFVFGTVRHPTLQPMAGVDIDVRVQATDAKVFTPHDDSDANGFYSIVIPPGTYKVLFRPQPATGLPVRVIENIVLTQDRNLDCTLQNGVRLFGTTRDPKGNALTGSTLSVFDAVTGARVWTFGSTSDTLGSYEAALLAGRHYDLVYRGPSPWGYEDVLVDSLLISGPTLRDIQFGFPNRMRGRVQQSANGQPAANIKIDVNLAATGEKLPLPSNTTDINGNYEVRVPDGIVDVTFRSPEGNGLASHIIRSVAVSGDLDLNALLAPGFTVSGRVRGPGGIGVANVDFDIKDAVTRLDVPVFDDDTDPMGDYTLVLPAGTYDLEVDPGHGVRLVAQVRSGFVVPHVGALDFQLEPGVLLSGRVIDHISNPWPDIDLDVLVAGTPTQIITPGDDTDASGNYMVTVPPGNYDLAFTPPPGIPVSARTFMSVTITSDLVFDAMLYSTVIGIEEPESAPHAGFTLDPNHPNPFNPSTAISFSVGEAGPVTLRVIDVGGRVVRTLLAGPVPSGRHELRWDGRDAQGGNVASGVYFLRLETPGGARSQKMVLAR